MKRFCLYFLTALLAFSVGVLASLTRTYNSIDAQAPDITALPLESPCIRDAFTLKRQPEATMQLNIVEAHCNGSSWNARLTLQNVGPKSVRGYEVANIEDYEHKHGCQSSQGVMASEGVLLAPGASKTLNFGGGFLNGLSYGKPTGSIQKNVFWIKRIEYTDGTSWTQSEQIR
jgi:hypothetical protein